jgi:hypothetical protein
MNYNSKDFIKFLLILSYKFVWFLINLW